jgi:hypothetical protein
VINQMSAPRTNGRAIHGMTASRKAVSRIFGEGRTTAKHFLKRGQRSADDLNDEAAHKIKRVPFGSVTAAFGAGILAGMLIWRNGKGS